MSAPSGPDRASPGSDGVFEPVSVTVDRRAAEQPERPAITDSGRELNYGELVAESRRFAAELRDHGVGTGDVVALHLPRGCDLVVALLAVSRIGAASLLLDRSGPADWLAGFVAAARPAALVSDAGETGFFDGPVLRPPAGSTVGPGATAPDAPVGPEDVACLVQTSGTTGVPKLVVVPHRTWTYAAESQRELHRVTADECGAWLFPAHTNVSASVVIWPFLTAGARLVVPGDDLLATPAELAPWLRARQVTQFFAVAPLAEALARLPWPPSALWLMLTGSDRVREWGGHDLPFEVGNWYGANEVNIVTSSVLPWSRRITSATATPRDRSGPPPIGRCWPGTRHRIVDPVDGSEQDAGLVGELCVGGRQLALGYLSPRQTADKFRPDPFGPPGSRTYRTGDLVRERDGGVLEHCGRLDEQVKINGLRVEMAEVEQQLLRCAGVVEAAAAAVEDPSGRLQLVGYVVAQATLTGSGTIDQQALRRELADRLPSHMVPVAYVQLARLPRNRGDKIDRRALPPPAVAPAPETAAVDPVEERVTRIWAEALDQPDCGAEDNFFLLGGDSLRASRAAALINTAFGADVGVKDVLTNPTSREFAALLRQPAA